MTRVVNVAAKKSADHGAAERAVCSPPSPMASVIGIMPAIIAQLVMRMGRSRCCAPVNGRSDRRSASAACALCEGNQQNGIGHRDADGHDRPHERLDVQRGVRDEQANATPVRTAGAVRTTASGQPPRLEISGQQQEDHDHGEQKPGVSPS